VVAVGELDKNGTSDPEVFELAQLLECMLLTHNTEDFHELHIAGLPALQAVSGRTAIA
jgi:predicted nuclease of predicted toxin-antitoxin system